MCFWQPLEVQIDKSCKAWGQIEHRQKANAARGESTHGYAVVLLLHLLLLQPNPPLSLLPKEQQQQQTQDQRQQQHAKMCAKMQRDAPYKQAANMSSRRLPSLSPMTKAPTEPARAPNRELLTTRPERKGDKLYLR